MQTPVFWIGLHVAPVGHPPTPGGLQMSAHALGVVDGAILTAHWDWAVAPPGAGGHLTEAEQPGLQIAPLRPVRVRFFSPEPHACVAICTRGW